MVLHAWLYHARVLHHSHIDGGEWLLFLRLLFLLGSLLLLPLEASQLVLDPPLLPLHIFSGLLVLIRKLGANLFPSWKEGTEQEVGSTATHTTPCPYRGP